MGVYKLLEYTMYLIFYLSIIIFFLFIIFYIKYLITKRSYYSLLLVSVIFCYLTSINFCVIIFLIFAIIGYFFFIMYAYLYGRIFLKHPIYNWSFYLDLYTSAFFSEFITSIRLLLHKK